jgi:gliding motility-associated-like protein
MNSQILKRGRSVGIGLLLTVLAGKQVLFAQSPCMATVPSFTINLTGQPAGVWQSPNISRQDQCCSKVSPDQCIYFYLILDPNAAGIQIDMFGADPPGSLFYDINCTGNYPGGTIKCINGVGPHQITFCKPGSNKNIYKITSISKPMFPKDDTVRIGCKTQLISLGVLNNSVTWQSIYPGTPGQYNSYLDSTNVASPTYSPASNAPAYIDYKVCGFPIASNCGYSVAVCDTVRIYNFGKLTGTVTPNPATFCNVGPSSGITLTGNASGGSPAYSFTWYNSANVVVGTGSSYFASTAGNYNLQIKDILYDPVNCPATYTSVSVTQGTLPVVDACPSKKVCASNPAAALSATVQYAPGGIWTGGTGTFSPGNTFLNTNYTPSAAELSAGFVKLYFTSTGAGGGCVNAKDSTIIYYSKTPTVTISGAGLACNTSTTTLNANVSGGTGPYTYLWNTGSNNNLIFTGQGNYSVLVSDSLGCKGNNSYNLIAPPALNISFSVTNVSVNGGNNGSATVTASGGTAAYSVTWSPGNQNTFSISNLIYGVYTATVTDANGCQMAGSTVVNEPRCLGFSASVSSTNVACYGNATGTASVNVTGGTPAYTYTWNTNPAQNTAVAGGLNAGVYTAVIKDANNCYQTANVIISEPTLLINTMTYTNVSVTGGNNGAAAANPFGGVAPYSYLWNTSASSSSITNLFAGSYTVNITDTKGCVKIDSVRINEPPCQNLTLNVFSNNASCFGGNNGSAFAIVNGAAGSYTISWSTGAFGPSISNLSAGNYSVNIKDANNCMQFANFSVIQPSQLSVGLQAVNVRCNGTGDGSINLNITGGTYPYSFAWSNSSNAEDQVYLSAGSYSVQITDANGCTAVASASITQPAPIAVTYTSQNVSCIYGNNGAIGVNVTGGTVPYTYTWSTSATTQSITNLSAGGYTVLVKDANNCTLSSPITISILQPDSVKVDSFIVACSVPSSGQTQVTVVPSGGTGSYQVSFDNGSTFQPSGVYTSMLNNAATYSVILKDANGCLSLASGILTIKPEVKIDSIRYAKCYAIGTTSVPVTVFPSGGDNGPYTMSFDNGGSYLSAGTYSYNLSVASTYSILIKDARGCVSGMSVITLPSVLNATTSVTSNYNGQNISCFGLSDGSALVSAGGGTGAYTFSWSCVPTQTTSSANNLSAGTYSVLILDGNGCSVTKLVTLNQPPVVSPTAIVTSNYNGQNISCHGYSDGSANVTVSGGTAPYSYQWNTLPVQTNSAAVNLSAGTYSVLVKDANNCIFTSTVFLTQPASINSTLSVISNYNGQNISCFGSSDGQVMANASDGTGPFTYTWSTSPVQTGNIASGLTAGSYSVIITDANGCNYTRTISVTEPTALIATGFVTSNYNGQNISCNGMADGSASVTANGGTTPYSYAWATSSSQLGPLITGLGAGSYSAVVTDANGCKGSAMITLTEPLPISISKSTDGLKCYGDSIGNIKLLPNGGTSPYSYQWSTGVTTSSLTGVGCGTYSATITDANGCKLTDTTRVSQPDSLSASYVSPLAYSGFNISNSHGSDGSIDLHVTGGTSPYTYYWSNGNNTEDISNLSAGLYNVVVVDSNGCRLSLEVNLTEPLDLAMPQGYSPNDDGKNDHFVIHGIEAYPDNELTIYNRWGNIVYSKKGYANDWNGISNNGLALPNATYFAIFEVNKGEIVLKGYVELRR